MAQDVGVYDIAIAAHRLLPQITNRPVAGEAGHYIRQSETHSRIRRSDVENSKRITSARCAVHFLQVNPINVIREKLDRLPVREIVHHIQHFTIRINVHIARIVRSGESKWCAKHRVHS